MRIKDNRKRPEISWYGLYEDLKEYIAEDVDFYSSDYNYEDDDKLINAILDDLYLNTDADWIILHQEYDIGDIQDAQMLVDDALYNLISSIIRKKRKGKSIYDSRKRVRPYKKSRY